MTATSETYSFDQFVDLIEDFYREIDEKLSAHLVKNRAVPSCARCTEPACCHLKVTVNLYEVLPLARHLKNNDLDTPELRDKLRAVGEQAEGSTSNDWLNKYIPCVFLQDKRCSVYPVRPVRCRSYLVMSDPSLCQPPARRTVQYVNDEAVMDASVNRAREYHRALGLKETAKRIMIGVLPRVLLIVLEAWDSDDYRSTIRRAKWPSDTKLKNGWFEGNNLFSTIE